MIKPYRIGKKVGVIRLSVEKNVNYIDKGKIVARKYAETWREIKPIYAVQFADGLIEVYRHDELWQKVKEEEL